MSQQGWSTRQVAELAGTTVKAVRHYHKLGLLDEPERSSNGYKHYGVDQLVRLVRIRRLTDLGVPLSQIAAMGESDEHPDDVLRELDAELASTIDRLQTARAELGEILQQRLPTDLPAELARAMTDIPAADRALMVVYSRVLGPEGIDAFARMLADNRKSPEAAEFDNLPGDTDDATCAALASRMLPATLRLFRNYPEVMTAQIEAPGGPGHTQDTIRTTIDDVYNPAQRAVLAHLQRLLQAEASKITKRDSDRNRQPDRADPSLPPRHTEKNEEEVTGQRGGC